MTRFLVIVEKGPTSYGVSAPDVDGCIAVGKTREEALERFREALQAHLELLALGGDTIPEPTITHDYVDVIVPTSADKAS